MKLYDLYIAIGATVMGIIAGSVIFAVIMRYFFGVSFTFLEELISVLFAFSTYWGIGACVLENENIIIDFLVDRLKPASRRIVDIICYLLMLIVNIVVLCYSISWIKVAGKVISSSLKIQFYYIYGLMPLGFVVGILCVFVKLFLLFTNRDKDVQFGPEDDDIAPSLV